MRRLRMQGGWRMWGGLGGCIEGVDGLRGEEWEGFIVVWMCL